jgi:ferredoxin
MKVTVDKDKCMACGVCETDAPEIFSLSEAAYAVVLMDEVPESFRDAIQTAIDDCPEQAIEIVETA